MKKIIIVLLISFIGLGFIGCSMGGDNGLNNHGTITITNIPDEFNGRYGHFWAFDPFLGFVGEIRTNNQRLSGRIENNSVTLPLWMFEARPGAETVPFNGNHTITSGWEVIDGMSRNSGVRFGVYNQPDDNEPLIWVFFPSVTFVNGRATLDWRNNSEIMRF